MASNYIIAIRKGSPIWICEEDEGDERDNPDYTYIKIDKEVFDLLLSMKSKNQDTYSGKWIKLSV